MNKKFLFQNIRTYLMYILQKFTHDGLYKRAIKAEKEQPSHRFQMAFTGIGLRQLWKALSAVFTKLYPGMLESLTLISEDSSTSWKYGPTMRDILDNHGNAIRNTSNNANPNNLDQKDLGEQTCQCCILFPDFIDPAVSHVRTSNTEILGTTLGPLARKGLNFRPTMQISVRELQSQVLDWVHQVMNALERDLQVASSDPWFTPEDLVYIADSTSEQLYRSKSLKPVNGLSAAHLKSLATPLQAVLVTVSTDKVANTPAFECKAFYQQTALNRLYSEAFIPLPMVDVDEHSYPLPVQLEAVELWAPWALNSDFSASILFPTPKLHKRAKDPMAYRYITSACSDYSKPVSDETVRVLTFLMGEARNKCIQLGLEHNAKYWWAIDCMDILSLNLDFSRRPDRHLGAFDLDKCFESIPLHPEQSDSSEPSGSTGHSLMEHLSFLVSFVFPGESGEILLCSKVRKNGRPYSGCYWGSVPEEGTLQYSGNDVLDLVESLLSLAIIQVGNHRALQGVGIPMGFSASVILLNMYMFKPEFLFVEKLVSEHNTLAVHTKELFRYVDDLSTFGMDLRPFLVPGPHSIYPIHPYGPLGITDQTVYLPNGDTQVIYLNMDFSLKKGQLSCLWFDKASLYDFACVYTHADSNLSKSCLRGIMVSQVRAVVLASFGKPSLKVGLSKLVGKFQKIGFKVSSDEIAKLAKHYKEALPISY